MVNASPYYNLYVACVDLLFTVRRIGGAGFYLPETRVSPPVGCAQRVLGGFLSPSNSQGKGTVQPDLLVRFRLGTGALPQIWRAEGLNNSICNSRVASGEAASTGASDGSARITLSAEVGDAVLSSDRDH